MGLPGCNSESWTELSFNCVIHECYVTRFRPIAVVRGIRAGKGIWETFGAFALTTAFDWNFEIAPFDR